MTQGTSANHENPPCPPEAVKKLMYRGAVGAINVILLE
jgi:hypothetical protein